MRLPCRYVCAEIPRGRRSFLAKSEQDLRRLRFLNRARILFSENNEEAIFPGVFPTRSEARLSLNCGYGPNAVAFDHSIRIAPAAERQFLDISQARAIHKD